MRNSKKSVLAVFTLFVVLVTALGAAFAVHKSNILIIWGDDFVQTHVSAYGQSMMAYATLNIDRIEKKSTMFTDYHGGQIKNNILKMGVYPC